MSESSGQGLQHAIEADDAAAIASLEWARGEALDKPLPGGGLPLAAAKSIETARMLLERGASLSKLSEQWASGFSLRKADQNVARFLVAQGAEVTIHAASGLGLREVLVEMLAADSSLTGAKGGDGATPLHFARDVSIAVALAAYGADLDARDDDHDSTPAQWHVRDAPEVTRFLLGRGASPDIFLAAALGDRALAEGLIARGASCLEQRIGKAPFHPIGHEGKGGTILQWTLGFNSYAHQIAAKKGHDDLFQVLMERSEPSTRFLVCCVMAKRDEAERLARQSPGLVASLPDADLELLARYCWETNVDIEAVRLMLDLGFPVAHPENSHGWSPLHNASWGGYADLVDLLIERGHPLDVPDPRFNATPLGFAIHCATVDGRHPDGDYERVVGSLIDAGAQWDPAIYPTGDSRVDRALTPRLPSI